MQSLIKIKYCPEKRDTYLVIDKLEAKFQSVISFTGSQSADKRSFLNGVYGKKVNNVGAFQTTISCDAIVIDDTLVVDCECYGGLVSEQAYYEKIEDRKESKKLAKFASKKMATCIYAFSNAFVYFIRGGNVQSSDFVSDLSDIQSQNMIKNVNYPILFIACINDLGTICDKDLKKKIENIMKSYGDMVEKFTEMYVEIVPYLDGSDDAITNHSNVCKNIFDKIITKVKFHLEFPTSSKMKIPLPTNSYDRLDYLKEIVSEIDNDRKLMSSDRYAHVINAELYEELLEDASELIKNQIKQFPCKFIKIDDIEQKFIEKYHSVAYAKFSNMYIENFSHWLSETIEFNNGLVADNVKSRIDTIDNMIQLMYENNLTKYQPISNEANIKLINDYQLMFTSSVVDVEPELINNSIWKSKVNELYTSYYVACPKKCVSRKHVCTLGGEHDLHIFNSDKCEKKPGDCDSKLQKILFIIYMFTFFVCACFFIGFVMLFSEPLTVKINMTAFLLCMCGLYAFAVMCLNKLINLYKLLLNKYMHLR